MTPTLSERLSRGWNEPPAQLPARRPTYEVAVVAILLLSNLAANVVVPDGGALPLSAVVVAVLLWLAYRSGVSSDYLGLQRASLRTGLRVGGVALAVIVGVVVILAAIPTAREYFADDRFVGVAVPEMLYEVLVRIPLATALAEEIAFRGVLLGMLLLWMSPLRALVVSSLLFGLWHVLPAIDALDTNPAADIARGGVASVVEVVVQVLVTGLAGAGFAWLRFRGRHVAAPALAHWAINGSAYLAGWLVVRHAWA